MADLLKTGSDWLQDMQATHVSQTVTYARGVYSVELAATVGARPRESLDANGQLIVADVVDFLIHKADLVLNGSATLPARGDTITDAAGQVHEVLPPGTGEDHYRFSDAYGRRLRVHTKRTS